MGLWVKKINPGYISKTIFILIVRSEIYISNTSHLNLNSIDLVNGDQNFKYTGAPKQPHNFSVLCFTKIRKFISLDHEEPVLQMSFDSTRKWVWHVAINN